MPPAIATHQLRKRFHARGGPVNAVRDVSMEVGRAEIVGFLGPNGAGKTTTLRMVTTLLPIDGGTAVVAGRDVGRDPAGVRARIGYVSQLGGADDFLTGRENLVLQARMYGVRPAAAEARSTELIAAFELSAFADRPARGYSGGQRRRLDIALGVVHAPEVLFLDEPSTGLDPQNRTGLWDHIRTLRAGGTTVFVTTHYLDEADALCDRVLIIDQGRIVARGTPADLKRKVGGDVVRIGLDGGEVGPALSLLSGAPQAGEAAAEASGVRLYVRDGSRALPGLLRRLEDGGLTVRALSLTGPSLDDVFLAYTGRMLRDAG